jgi:hypothetical protein
MSGAAASVPQRDDIRSMIGDWTGVPAVLRDRHLTVVASNALARALSPGYAEGVNIARFTFLESAAFSDDPCWSEVTGQVGAMLRDSLEQHEEDARFRDIVGELSAKSYAFSEVWAHNSRASDTGRANYVHSAVGAFTLGYRQLWVAEDHDDVLMVWRPVDAESRTALARLSEIVGGA